MSKSVLCASLLLLAILMGAALADDGPTTDAEVRGSVERSLPFLERGGVAWIKERGCMSCHVFSFTLWTHYSARQHGLKVDAAKLAEWTSWAREESLKRREWFKLTEASLQALAADGVPEEVRAKLSQLKDRPFVTEQDLTGALEGVLSTEEMARHRAVLVKRAAVPRSAANDGGGLDTVQQLVLGVRPSAGTAADAAWGAALRELISQWQEPDGSWRAAGQLPGQDRPRAESNEVTTAWTALALDVAGGADPNARKALEAARARLKGAAPGKSTESLAVGLLVERKLGAPERAGALLEELRKQQNPDGGWGWRRGGPSDAFTTGQTLYALSLSGLPAADPAVARARRYLLKTQGEDGSWSVPPEAFSASTGARLKKLEPIYRYWGSAWAVIGLLETLPEAGG